MTREALSEKILVLGVDGLDPKLTKRFVEQGCMPNVAELIRRGAQREDLALLGGVPTITPPMWTTLATGAYPSTHGITCFWNQTTYDLEEVVYALDSRLCQAEPLWNIFAQEAGKKTLVWHWPGSSWPPTSESPNLAVVEGTQPTSINMGVAKCDDGLLVVSRGNHIWLNLKGRNKYGIVEEADKYALEDKIIDDLYNYRDDNGQRIISVAMRNKEAALLGMSGPECGDIIYWNKEGLNRIHGDSLSTYCGYFDTTVSPIFIAAGAGLKQGVVTERVIRQVDVAPTIAILGGVRLPRECEGAPVYQILAQEL